MVLPGIDTGDGHRVTASQDLSLISLVVCLTATHLQPTFYDAMEAECI